MLRGSQIYAETLRGYYYPTTDLAIIDPESSRRRGEYRQLQMIILHMNVKIK